MQENQMNPRRSFLELQESLTELIQRLESRSDGLTSMEAQKRLQKNGANEFVTARWQSQFAELVKAWVNPITLILLLACLASVILHEIYDAVIIAVIVVLSGALNFLQTFRSEKAVRALQATVAPVATVLRDRNWREIARKEIVPGDIIQLSSGDLVPADVRLLTADDLHVQQSALTGESFPVEKFPEEAELKTVGPSAASLLYLGTSVVSGTGTGVVFATGSETSFGDIVERLAARPEETEFEKGIRRFSQLILQSVIFLVLFILVVHVAMGRDALHALLFAVALAVGLTPEFLPMITTLTLAEGAVQMAKEKVIVKHLSAIQNLGSIDVLCTDKTGTLTAGSMSVEATLDLFGTPSNRPLELARLNSEFESGIRSPIDEALLKTKVAPVKGYEKTDEIPFDFNRRRLSVVVAHDQKYTMITKGAPESILEICHFFESEGEVLPLLPEVRSLFLKTFETLSRQGFRVLAVASKVTEQPRGFRIEDENDLILAGFISFSDHLLAGVAETFQALLKDGVEVKILTGDNELVTAHICEKLNLHIGRIVLGHEIETADEVALGQIAEEARVFARVTPSQKHRILQALKARHHTVGFLGDGINDAPSLHSADVGISVSGAVDIARESSDLILLEKRLDVLHAGILAGRKAFGNVFKYLLMETSSNFGNMLSMAVAALVLPFLPMLPTQILLNNFLYDLAQVAIPADNVDPEIIRRPQKWDIRLIRNFMLLIGPVSSIYDFVTFYVLLEVFHFGQKLFHTGWFIESLATQTLVVFVIRSVAALRSSAPSRLLVTSTVSVLVTAFLLPYSPLAARLGFESLPGRFLYFLVAVVFIYLWMVNAIKKRLMKSSFFR